MLPLAVYLFTHKLFRCHLASCLACALTASSLHLAVFGTHCLVNSFTAPFVFFGLNLCFSSHLNKVDMSEFSQDAKLVDMNENISCGSVDEQMSLPTTEVINCLNRKKKHFDGIIHKDEVSETSDHAMFSRTPSGQVRNRINGTFCMEYKHLNGAKSSLINEISTHKTNIKRVGKWNSKISWTWLRVLFGGFLIGTTGYIRVDILLFASVLYLAVLFTENVFTSQDFKTKIKEIILIMLGGIFALCIGVLYDCWKYGHLVIPPLQWIQFNLISNSASILFGAKEAVVYTNVFFCNRFYGLMNISLLFIYSYYYVICKKKSRSFYLSVAVHTSFFIILTCYLLVGHKEARLLHNIIVLYFILVSYAVHILIQKFYKYGATKWKVAVGTTLFLIAFGLNSYQSFPSANDSSSREWTYRNATASKDVNICLDYISRMTDVRGVMLDESIFETHGFSVLRHDVPLLTKVHNEYHLYTAGYSKSFAFGNRIRILNKYSDYVYVRNSHYLCRLLGRTNSFNYVITKRNKLFAGMKYFEVYKAGNYMVLLRNLTAFDEKKLNKQADELPLGNNSTVLEYETGWLLSAGLNDLAAKRAERSLELDKSRVRVFQLLMVAYGRANLWKEVEKYQNLCFSLHSQEVCETNQEKLVLHDEYRQFDSI